MFALGYRKAERIESDRDEAIASKSARREEWAQRNEERSQQRKPIIIQRSPLTPEGRDAGSWGRCTESEVREMMNRNLSGSAINAACLEP